ncbi:4040_t:CDS:2, partial [Racocetra persica]
DVKLTKENLAFDSPVPKTILRNISFEFSKEFTYIRYTTITCDPDEFVGKKYIIRQNDYNTLNVLSAIRCYQDGIMQDSVRRKPITVHLFEYTTQLIVDNDFKVQGKNNNIPPVQVMFCLKEKNAKKLNSHRWSFNAFAPLLGPKILHSYSFIYLIYPAFNRNSDIGSACGEIKVDLGHRWRNLLNPLVASQNFEYKMSNILDKPFESAWLYFSETMHGSGVSKTEIFEANMYLAEDHILSFELSTTSNPATDPFKGHEDKLFDAARSLYLIIIVIVFICSMGNHPQETKLIYILSVPPIDFRSTSSIQEALKNAAFQDIVITVSLTYLPYLFSSFIHCEPWHITKRDNTNTGNLNDKPEEANKVTIKINVIEKKDIDASYNNIIDELKLKVTKKSNIVMPLQRKMIIIDCLEQI